MPQNAIKSKTFFYIVFILNLKIALILEVLNSDSKFDKNRNPNKLTITHSLAIFIHT